MVKSERIFRLLWLLGHVLAELTIEVSEDVSLCYVCYSCSR